MVRVSMELYLCDFRHIPTIKFKGIVLQSEKWKINLQELKLKKNNFENFKEKFLEWMTEIKCHWRFILLILIIV